VECFNDFCPIALTPVITKCFERLILSHIKANIPKDLDIYQFPYRANRSTDDSVSIALHTALTHLEQPNSYVRMLFIDFSSTFNTVRPHKLVCKLSNLGIDAALCVWIMDPLTNRPQNVKIGDCTSSTSFVNTGVPQGCVLSPVIFTLFTHDCAAIHPFNATVKFADTTIVGLFSENEETTYREEVQHFVQ